MATMTDSDVALLQALADPNRLAIVRKLVQEGEAGVVATTRQGTSIRYRLHPQATRRLAALLSSLIPTDTQPVATR